MVNIVLAAGYATRMYPLTENFPKPLLEVKGRTLLGALMEDVDSIPEISEHIIITNHKFYDQFRRWNEVNKWSKPVTVIDDGSVDNEHRVGAVGDLFLAMDYCLDRRADRNVDFMVLAADNILDFSLSGFVAFFKEKRASVIMCHHEDSVEALQRTGVVVLDDESRVLEMAEKPLEPKSHWAVPPFYIYSHEDLPLIYGVKREGCNFDAPGNLAHYLCEKGTVYAWKMPGRRIDIGNLQTYYSIK